MANRYDHNDKPPEILFGEWTSSDEDSNSDTISPISINDMIQLENICVPLDPNSKLYIPSLADQLQSGSKSSPQQVDDDKFDIGFLFDLSQSVRILGADTMNSSLLSSIHEDENNENSRGKLKSFSALLETDVTFAQLHQNAFISDSDESDIQIITTNEEIIEPDSDSSNEEAFEEFRKSELRFKSQNFRPDDLNSPQSNCNIKRTKSDVTSPVKIQSPSPNPINRNRPIRKIMSRPFRSSKQPRTPNQASKIRIILSSSSSDSSYSEESSNSDTDEQKVMNNNSPGQKAIENNQLSSQKNQSNEDDDELIIYEEEMIQDEIHIETIQDDQAFFVDSDKSQSFENRQSKIINHSIAKENEFINSQSNEAEIHQSIEQSFHVNEEEDIHIEVQQSYKFEIEEEEEERTDNLPSFLDSFHEAYKEHNQSMEQSFHVNEEENPQIEVQQSYKFEVEEEKTEQNDNLPYFLDSIDEAYKEHNKSFSPISGSKQQKSESSSPFYPIKHHPNSVLYDTPSNSPQPIKNHQEQFDGTIDFEKDVEQAKQYTRGRYPTIPTLVLTEEDAINDGENLNDIVVGEIIQFEPEVDHQEDQLYFESSSNDEVTPKNQVDSLKQSIYNNGYNIIPEITIKTSENHISVPSSLYHDSTNADDDSHYKFVEGDPLNPGLTLKTINNQSEDKQDENITEQNRDQPFSSSLFNNNYVDGNPIVRVVMKENEQNIVYSPIYTFFEFLNEVPIISTNETSLIVSINNVTGLAPPSDVSKLSFRAYIPYIKCTPQIIPLNPVRFGKAGKYESSQNKLLIRIPNEIMPYMRIPQMCPSNETRYFDVNSCESMPKTKNKLGITNEITKNQLVLLFELWGDNRILCGTKVVLADLELQNGYVISKLITGKHKLKLTLTPSMPCDVKKGERGPIVDITVSYLEEKNEKQAMYLPPFIIIHAFFVDSVVAYRQVLFEMSRNAINANCETLSFFAVSTCNLDSMKYFAKSFKHAIKKLQKDKRNENEKLQIFLNVLRGIGLMKRNEETKATQHDLLPFSTLQITSLRIIELFLKKVISC